LNSLGTILTQGSDGNRYLIHIRQKHIPDIPKKIIQLDQLVDAITNDNSPTALEHLLDFYTDSGEKVIIDKHSNKFVIINSCIILTPI
jgi:hypothetical protein